MAVMRLRWPPSGHVVTIKDYCGRVSVATKYATTPPVSHDHIGGLLQLIIVRPIGQQGNYNKRDKATVTDIYWTVRNFTRYVSYKRTRK